MCDYSFISVAKYNFRVQFSFFFPSHNQVVQVIGHNGARSFEMIALGLIVYHKNLAFDVCVEFLYPLCLAAFNYATCSGLNVTGIDEQRYTIRRQ